MIWYHTKYMSNEILLCCNIICRHTFLNTHSLIQPYSILFNSIKFNSIQFNSILSNPIQSNPIQSHPIQSYPDLSYSMIFYSVLFCSVLIAYYLSLPASHRSLSHLHLTRFLSILSCSALLFCALY